MPIAQQYNLMFCLNILVFVIYSHVQLNVQVNHSIIAINQTQILHRSTNMTLS